MASFDAGSSKEGLASSRVLGSEEDMLGFENLQGRRTLAAIPPVFFP